MKITFVGNKNSGKTALVRSLVGARTSNIEPTVGVEVRSFGKYSIWDISGDVKYAGLRDGYLLGTEKIFLVLDGSLPESGTKDWIKETLKFARKANFGGIIITKSDLEQKLELPNWIEKKNLKVFRISSTTGFGMDELRSVF